MVAYSFRPRFVGPILAGSKRQTIRAGRRRHAAPGEEVQLYTGMRTRHCKLIGRAKCIATYRIVIDLVRQSINAEEDPSRDWEVGVPLEFPAIVAARTIDDFARLDGFEDWPDMRAFWRGEHPGVDEFIGWLITWGPLL